MSTGHNPPKALSPASFSIAGGHRRPLQSFTGRYNPINQSTMPSPPMLGARLHSPLNDLAMTQDRAISRSSSVPALSRSANSHGGMSESAVPSPLSQSSSEIPTQPKLASGGRHETSSVKHLTCFWWKEKGSCRHKDEDCLYAHYDTGHYTDPPRQLVPGEPALAGRKLDRAMRNMVIATHRSSSSLNNMAGISHDTRPSTPAATADFANDTISPLSASQSSNQQQFGISNDLTRLNNDNQFLRNLVESATKEKAVMINTIEGLQTEKEHMQAELEGLRKAQEQLLAEREGLHKRIKELQGENVRGANNPFGAIGRRRMDTETHYLGGLLSEE